MGNLLGQFTDAYYADRNKTAGSMWDWLKDPNRQNYNASDYDNVLADTRSTFGQSYQPFSDMRPYTNWATSSDNKTLDIPSVNNTPNPPQTDNTNQLTAIASNFNKNIDPASNGPLSPLQVSQNNKNNLSIPMTPFGNQVLNTAQPDQNIQQINQNQDSKNKLTTLLTQGRL